MGNTFRVSMGMGSCSCGYRHVCRVCMHETARRKLWASFLRNYPTWVLREGHSLVWSSLKRLRHLASKSQGSIYPIFPSCPNFLPGLWGPNSDPCGGEAEYLTDRAICPGPNLNSLFSWFTFWERVSLCETPGGLEFAAPHLGFWMWGGRVYRVDFQFFSDCKSSSVSWPFGEWLTADGETC